jgi:hypothetical protein
VRGCCVQSLATRGAAQGQYLVQWQGREPRLLLPIRSKESVAATMASDASEDADIGNSEDADYVA